MQVIRLNTPAIPKIKEAKMQDGFLREQWTAHPHTWVALHPMSASTHEFDRTQLHRGDVARTFYTVTMRKQHSMQLRIRQLELEDGRILHMMAPWCEGKRGWLETIAAEYASPTESSITHLNENTGENRDAI
jgi:hypothetical protein